MALEAHTMCLYAWPMRQARGGHAMVIRVHMDDCAPGRVDRLRFPSSLALCT